MGSAPSSFGSGDGAKPASLSTVTERSKAKNDVLDGATVTEKAYTSSSEITANTQVFTEIASASKLFDGNSGTNVTITEGQTVVVTGKELSRVSLLTVACDTVQTAPKGLRLEASANGTDWKTLIEETNVTFLFNKSILPFSVPEGLRGSYAFYRITLTGGTKLAELELIGEKGLSGESEDPFEKEEHSFGPWTEADSVYHKKTCTECGEEVLEQHRFTEWTASDEYPDNVFDVIFDEKYGQQFEPVGNGSVYADPTEEAIIATYLVLEGYNTVGASMYFLNPHLADDTWFRTDLQFCCTLGLMDFYQ